ncbi:Ankyrin repeats (3 copies) [Popillia japonica]|uniref:Ankyrin repeats (3 copies) n=1 Tax=Popillia japonica TaxID=7064 RepID=A0AAW1LZA9_POPJA
MCACLSRDSSYSPTETITLTALQLAARKGSIEQTRYLIESGADLDVGPDTALHIALRKGHSSIALLLLQCGADFDTRDSHGDYPIHIACALGLLDVVQTLCALGCSVEVPTAKGLYPLHLATKNGHIHIVRCLCSAGCNIDVKNTDNIRADITALKYGYNEIADLLDRLRVTGQRDIYARQLVPTSKPALRISLRLLGHCGVGKTALVKSLNAGLFSSFFRRSSSLQSNKSRPSSPNNTQIEMDVTSRQNSLTFESTGNYQSTSGIHMQNIDVSNIGEVSVWEFSGQENYFPSYHHFLWPSPYTLTAILFNLEDSPAVQIQQICFWLNFVEDSPAVQIQQICFWLNFVMARQPADLPTSEYGRIILVATHVDSTRAAKTQQGEWLSPDAQKTAETVKKILPHTPDAQKTAETVKKILPHTPNLVVNPIIMDCNVPASFAFKQLKSILSSIKQDCIQQTIGTWTGLLEATLAWLATLQKDFEQLPVLARDLFAELLRTNINLLARDLFAELLRTNINLLASDDHIHELLQQLHSMGEVFCVQDLVVISVQWLGTQLIGELLSNQFILQARVTGVYTTEDFQASFNQCDAAAVLELLKSLELCVECHIDGEIEYEFPVYNHIETLSGLWDSGDPRYRTTGACYGGIALHTPPRTCHLFSSVFPYIQADLRRSTFDYYWNGDGDTDLYQWYHGSKLCTTTLETLITLNEGNDGSEYIEIKIRGPRLASRYCFYFFHEVQNVITTAINRICPGLLIERHILSSHQLRVHHLDPYSYDPQIVMSAMLDAESTLDVTLYNQEVERQESLVQLVLFDDLEIANNIEWGCALKVSDLCAPAKLKMCGLLDPPEPHGRDWCLLALKLGLSQERIAALDSQHSSHTMRLLTIADCSIGNLITSLLELDRGDVAEIVSRSAPILRLIEPVEV